MKIRILSIIAAICIATECMAQIRYSIQHKPYIDLRPMHFGISVGMNMQDIEFESEAPIVCDADRWNSGLSVGVLADMRLSSNLNLRISPTMHFGSKHLMLMNTGVLNTEGKPMTETQDMKNTYLSVPVDLKFSSQRWNNIRPYMLAGVSPMINLTSKSQEIIQLKRTDLTDRASTSVADLKDDNKKMYANAINSGHTKMIVLSFYFE